MVKLIGTDAIRPPPSSCPSATTATVSSSRSSSFASVDHSDVEDGGSSSSSSRDESRRRRDGAREGVVPTTTSASPSKFVTRRGAKFPRRRSQCERLSFRVRMRSESPVAATTAGSSSSSSPSPSSRPVSAPASHPAAVAPPRGWNPVLSSEGADLPKTIQFYPPPSDRRSRPAPPTRRGGRSALLAIVALLLSLASAVVQQRVTIAALRRELEATNRDRDRIERSRSRMASDLEEGEGRSTRLRESNERLTRLNARMEGRMAELTKGLAERDEKLRRLGDAEGRASRCEGRWDDYVAGVRERSLTRLLDRYGEGPHRVELEVRLPSSPGTELIEIDLASPESMPHSVQTFLDQVSAGAWDGTAFDVLAGHVVMAHAPGEEEDVPSSGRHDVPEILVPEYDADHPHDAYTVGFPVRKGGNAPRGFYVNLRDNSRYHSPRVVEAGDGYERSEGEPCFGRIAEGTSRTVVDRMTRLRAEGEMLAETVAIVSARIVGGYRR